MTFNDFCQVIKHLRKNYKCPACNETFNINYIHIVANAGNEGILFIECTKCLNPIFVIFSLNPDIPELIIKTRTHKNIKNAPEKYSKKNYAPVNQNDILDMYNFLKNHQGDLTPFLK